MTTLTKSPTTLDQSVVSHAPERTPWERWQPAGFFLEIVLLVITAVLFLEFYFRTAAVGQQEFLQSDLAMGCKHIVNKQVVWRFEGFSNDKLSSVGLRDSEHSLIKPAGVYRIALLGDSATESLQVPLDQTYGKVLERILNEQLLKQADAGAAMERPYADNTNQSGYAWHRPYANRASNRPNGVKSKPHRALVPGGAGVPPASIDTKEPAGSRRSQGVDIYTDQKNKPGRADAILPYNGAPTGASTNGKVVPVNSNLIKHFEVINFGCSSYSTGQELLQYEQEVVRYNPDAVVLLYNRGDSIENVIDPKIGKKSELRPYFYLGKTGQLLEDRSLLDTNVNKLRPQPLWDFLRAHSCLYGVFSQANLSLTLNESKYRWLKSLTDRASKFIAQSAERPGKGSEHFTHIKYPPQDALSVTKGILKTLAKETAEHKQKFVLMVFPNNVHDPTLTEQAKALKPFAEEINCEYLDLSPTFLNSPLLASAFLQYHFSATGHKLLANTLSGCFLKPNSP